MSLISSRVNAKQAITGVKVYSRYRDDIERYRRGKKTVSE